MRLRIIYIGTLLILIILYIGGCRNAGNWLVKKDKPLHADAMVVLMGSIPDRVLQAADIYNEGLTQKVIMVEAGQSGNERELKERGAKVSNRTRQSRKIEISLGIPADSIVILPGGATSTQMEAIIVREYIKQEPGLDTLLLVTSSYHTRRASMIFRSAFSKAGIPVHIIFIPSKYSNFNGDNWWKSKDAIEIIFMEYIKIVNFIVLEKWKL